MQCTHVHDCTLKNKKHHYLEIVSSELQERVRHGVVDAVDADTQEGVAEARQGLERGPVEEGGAVAVRVPPLACVSQNLWELAEVLTASPAASRS